MSGLGDRVERLEKATFDLVFMDANAAYAELEKMANVRVEKSGDRVSFHKAFDAVLKTAKGKALYAQYRAGSDSARATIEKADAAPRQRDLERWAEEEFQSVVAKAERAGYDPERAINFARERRPELWPLVNRARPETVRKAAPTRGAVLKAAEEQFIRDLRDVAGGSPLPRSRPERVQVRKDAGAAQTGLEGSYLPFDFGDDWDDE